MMNDAQEDYLQAIYEIQLHPTDKPIGSSILATLVSSSARHANVFKGASIAYNTYTHDCLQPKY